MTTYRVMFSTTTTTTTLSECVSVQDFVPLILLLKRTSEEWLWEVRILEIMAHSDNDKRDKEIESFFIFICLHTSAREILFLVYIRIARGSVSVYVGRTAWKMMKRLFVRMYKECASTWLWKVFLHQILPTDCVELALGNSAYIIYTVIIMYYTYISRSSNGKIVRCVEIC